MSKNIRKQLREKKCIDCGQKLSHEHFNRLRCGSEEQRTGCAWQAKLRRTRNWHKKVKPTIIHISKKLKEKLTKLASKKHISIEFLIDKLTNNLL